MKIHEKTQLMLRIFALTFTFIFKDKQIQNYDSYIALFHKNVYLLKQKDYNIKEL